MPQILKPANLSLTWASGGDILDPGVGKYATGWAVEIPPRQWFNYLDNRQDTAIAHINQHGVAVWDAGTEYQGNKSYVQGPTNGTIYRSVQTNTNQNPEADVTNTYWITAFASAGDFLTEAQSDLRYLARGSNLSDLTNTATARNNLSVYSQAQTYTRAEVDSRTTVASTLQAQQQTSNTVLLSALRLAEAFKGSNQSLLGTGFQRLPGGLIIQWGSLTQNRGTTVNHTFPLTFPNVAITIVACKGAVITVAGESTAGADILSNSQFTVTNSGVGSPSQGIRWVAIGY